MTIPSHLNLKMSLCPQCSALKLLFSSLSLTHSKSDLFDLWGGERNFQSWDLKSFTHTDLVFINYVVWIGMATGTSPMRENSPYHLCLEGDIEKSREGTHGEDSSYFILDIEKTLLSPPDWLPEFPLCEARVKQYMEAYGDAQQWLQTPAPRPSGQVVTPWYWFFCWESKQ